MSLEYIIYISSMKKTYTQPQMEKFIHAFRSNNQKFNITGCLLYHDGIVLQYIEGHPHHITQLFDNISKDYRHDKIIVLLKDTIPERLFPDWKMGMAHSTTDPKLKDAFTNFLSVTTGDDITNNDRVNVIFNMFRYMNILKFPIYSTESAQGNFSDTLKQYSNTLK